MTLFSSPSYATMPRKKSVCSQQTCAARSTQVLASAASSEPSNSTYWMKPIPLHCANPSLQIYSSRPVSNRQYELPGKRLFAIFFTTISMMIFPTFAVSTLTSSERSTPPMRNVYILPCRVEPKRRWQVWAVVLVTMCARRKAGVDVMRAKCDLPLDVWPFAFWLCLFLLQWN